MAATDNNPPSSGALRDRREAFLRARLTDHEQQPKAVSPLVIEPAEQKHQPFPLTDLQLAYWLGRDESLADGAVAMHGYFEIDAVDFDHQRFEAAWNKVVRRHDMLHAIVLDDGRQRILEQDEFDRYEIASFDASNLSKAETEEYLTKRNETLSHRIADLAVWPQFHIETTRLVDGITRIHFSIDGWALDGWSHNVIFSELTELYQNPEKSLNEIGFSFRDFVLSAEKHANSDAYQQDWSYWEQKLPTMPPPPALPMDQSTSEDARFRRFEHRFDAKHKAALHKASLANQASLPSVILAAYGLVLGQWAEQRKFTVNVPQFNRPDWHDDMEKVVGEFASFSLVPLDVEENQTMQSAIVMARDALWHSLEHREVSGVKLLRELARLNETSQQAMPFVFTTAPTTATGESAASPVAALSSFGEIVNAAVQTPQVWLDCQYAETPEGIAVFWEAREGVFPPGMLDQMFALFVELLSDVDGWQRSVDDVSLALQDGMTGTLEGEPEKPYIALLDALLTKIRETPSAIAVIDGDHQFSYAEIDSQARALAADIKSAADGHGSDGLQIAAVLLDKGYAQVVAMLACQYAGVATSPIDIASPPDRQRMIIETLDACCVITDVSDAHFSAIRILPISNSEPLEKLAASAQPEDVLSVIFTSGSTGLPKGVTVTHGGMVNALSYTLDRFSIGSTDRVLAVTPFHHDMAAFDIFGLLMAGGTIVFPQKKLNAPEWRRLITQHQITIWNSVPSLARFLCQGAEPEENLPLRLAFVGGDKIEPELPALMANNAPDLYFVSVGGPTETTLWNIMYAVQDTEAQKDAPYIPYGQPISGTRYAVMDENQRLRPHWALGELCVHGVGVTPGYWKDDAQTEAAFAIEPKSGQQYYATGDLGFVRPDGHIVIKGRRDNMRNLNGVRIDPSEIENVLNKTPGIASSVAVLAGEAPQSLKGYVILDDSKDAEKFKTDLTSSDASDAMWDAAKEAGHAKARSFETLPEGAFAEFETEIGRIHKNSTLAAFAKLGVFTTKHETHSIDSLMAASGIKLRYRKWVNRALQHLISDGVISEIDGRYRCEIAFDEDLDTSTFDDVKQRIVEAGFYSDAQIDLLFAAGLHLDKLLTEQMHSAQLYTSEEVPGVYGTNFASCNEILAESFAAMMAARDDQTLSVLEVGAGLGVTTEFLQPYLPKQGCHYVFTDISNYFLDTAGEKFSDINGFETRYYDLEDDPLVQGYGRHTYDVVVASGVLHDTENLRRTLAHMRSVLKPGGLMYVILPVKMLRLFDLSMGLQGRFDSFEDFDLRDAHPLLSSQDWKALFESQGYEICEVFSQPGTLADHMGFEALLVRNEPRTQTLDQAELRNAARASLPETMTPQSFVMLEEFPLTRNGKIDRELMSSQKTDPLAARAAYVAPQNGIQEILAGIWSDVLDCEDPGIHDSFFALGGDSLKAATLIVRITDAMGVEVPIGEIFKTPTIERLSQLIEIELEQAIEYAD